MSHSCCTNNLAPGVKGADEADAGLCGAGHASAGAKRVEHFKPAVDVCETPDAFVLTLDLPGATSDSLTIEYEQGALTVGARITPRAFVGARPLFHEYSVGDYQRDFRIGTAINPAAIDANLKDGVLTLTLPKSEEVRARRIEVRTS